ncbi:nuclease-related domain-containing protein [Streptomyces sp. NPDC091376]|uniref:nuclease-related domain-containing protein n=1 Tax=Streptomyces sp. NPDC091376 TaxID=3365994 RepID=UPI00382A501B
MTGLRVTPVRTYGRSRLYVSLPGGRCVAWYDSDANRVSLALAELREEALAALAPYLTGEVSVGPPPVPTADDLARLSLHPDDDLAPNRPGEGLHLALDRSGGSSGPGRPSGSGLSSRPGRRRDPRRAELAAHELLGAELERLEDAGWRVLHAVPLPGDARIDHLLVGPAGVLALRTLAARGRRVRITGESAAAGRDRPVPELRLARRGAERASFALATAVRPVLAVVGAVRLAAEQAPPDVRILAEGEVAGLARLGGVLKPSDVESLYGRARNRRTWLRA